MKKPRSRKRGKEKMMKVGQYNNAQENLSQNSRYHLEEVHYHLLYLKESFEEFSYHLTKYQMNLRELARSIREDKNHV